MDFKRNVYCKIYLELIKTFIVKYTNSSIKEDVRKKLKKPLKVEVINSNGKKVDKNIVKCLSLKCVSFGILN